MENSQQCRGGNRQDEIDLAELFQGLWLQKTLIFSVVVLASVIATVYCVLSKPIYASSAVLAPAPINLYGSIAGQFKFDAGNSVNTPIAQGMALSNDTFRLYLTNLASKEVRQAFDAKFGYPNAPVELQIKTGREAKPFDDPASIRVDSSDSALAKPYLDGLIRYAAETTQQQVNSYFQASGIEQTLAADSLFRFESVSQPAMEVKPKRLMILTLSIVLGGMLGLFIALIKVLVLSRRPRFTNQG